MKHYHDIGEITFKVLHLLIYILIGSIFLMIIVGGIMNENNRIDSGVIVDKRMDSGGARLNSDKHGSHYYNDPPSYHFTIEGRKDGKVVQYTFEVSEEEYKEYKIGDQYSR